MGKTHRCFGICTIRIFLAVMLLAGQKSFLSAQTPQWVTDKNKAYPESEWLSVVESNKSRDQALGAANSALARVFKVDVRGVTSAMQNLSQTVVGGKTAVTQDTAIKQQVDTSSNVSGLMGVTVDEWAAPGGDVFVCARMNRRQGSATYSSIIKQNDKTIQTLIEDAEIKVGSFDAYQALNFAYGLATITDNYMNILSVLDSAARQSIKLSYGNAASVRRLSLDASNAIVINIDVTVTVVKELAGLQILDVNRIAKPFQEVFTKRKFKTTVNNASAAPYTLAVDFTLDKVDLQGNPNQFTRYVIKAALMDEWGNEILNFQDNKRSGHTSLSEAAQRSMRDAEAAITGDGFAKAFDAYLASLL
jgi:hypothetical protein